MITRSRNNNPVGAGEQSPDEDAISDTIRVNTPAEIEALRAENRRLREKLEAARRNASNSTTRRTRLSSPTPSDETSDVSERSEERRTAKVPPPIHELKVGKPNKFSGKHSEFLSFMTQCEAIFKMCPITYPNDEYKVLFIITNLDGSALRWAQDIFAKDDHPYRKDYQVF